MSFAIQSGGKIASRRKEDVIQGRRKELARKRERERVCVCDEKSRRKIVIVSKMRCLRMRCAIVR